MELDLLAQTLVKNRWVSLVHGKPPKPGESEPLYFQANSPKKDTYQLNMGQVPTGRHVAGEVSGGLWRITGKRT